MVKLLKKDRIKFLIIILLVNIIGVFTAVGKKAPGNDLTSALTSANYICLALNNIYIFYIYTRNKKIKSIFDKIIVRIGQDKFFNKFIINFIIDIIVYFIIVMLPIYLKLGLNMNGINLLILYLILNFTNFVIQEVVSMLIFLTEKGNKYIIIPIIMNFGFHYFLIPLIYNNMLGL